MRQLSLAIGRDVRGAERRSRRPNDPRAYGLAQLRVAHADAGDIGHLGMDVAIFLDFERADIFPTENDHVLRAAGDEEQSLHVDRRKGSTVDKASSPNRRLEKR